MLSRLALREGELERVQALAEDARARARDSGEPELKRMPLHMEAVAARMRGDLTAARRMYLESIDLNRSLGHQRMIAAELRNLAYVELRDGQAARAHELFAEARQQARLIENAALTP